MKLFEMKMTDQETQALMAWQAEVKKAYPNVAAKLQFRARVEKGVNTVSAEVNGEDRCYGVFDIESGKGVILGEAVLPTSKEHADLLAYHEHVCKSPNSKSSWNNLAKEAKKALGSGKLSAVEKATAAGILKDASEKAGTLHKAPVANVGAHAHLAKKPSTSM